MSHIQGSKLRWRSDDRGAFAAAGTGHNKADPSPPVAGRSGSTLGDSFLTTAGLLLLLLFSLTACRHPAPGTIANRRGDEIVVAGKFVHTGAPVVLWLDPGGYDAYRVERRFSKLEESSWEATSKATKGVETPNRYGPRTAALSHDDAERVRGGGWDLPTLQKTVDQFVLHFDVCGTSRQCFKVLHDLRGLSVHFMLDLDGTIYQTLDVKERAWHATTSNTRSVGIEIANMGAYGLGRDQTLDEWYVRDSGGRVRVRLPDSFGDGGIRSRGFVARPSRQERVQGTIQGTPLVQYDFTPEQYASLTRLTAALCTVLPRIRCDYPRDEKGQLIPHKLDQPQLDAYQGVLGHFHIQTNKVDPGPAFQWDKVINGARRLMRLKPVAGAGTGSDPVNAGLAPVRVTR